MYNKKWYKDLNKSPLTPPDYVFGIVWTCLYISLIVYGILTLKDSKCLGFCTPLIFFTIQMLFNLSWTTIFFKWRKPIIALLVVIIMIILTLITIYQTKKLNINYHYILIPYLMWICFACYLNTYIVINN